MKYHVPRAIRSLVSSLRSNISKLDEFDTVERELPVSKFMWYLGVPFSLYEGGISHLSPAQVLAQPARFASETDKLMKAKMDQPISVVEYEGKWFIVDGLRRLMKAVLLMREEIDVRVLPSQIVEPRFSVPESSFLIERAGMPDYAAQT